MQKDKSVEVFLARMNRIERDLKKAGRDISDSDKATVFERALRFEYPNIKNTLLNHRLSKDDYSPKRICDFLAKYIDITANRKKASDKGSDKTGRKGKDSNKGKDSDKGKNSKKGKNGNKGKY
jgi:hypothetical protein